MEPDSQTTIAMRGPPPPKKPRSLRFIRGLLLLLNRRSNKTPKSMQVDAVASSELLNKVVGTMRAQNCSVLPSDTPRVSLPVQNCSVIPFDTPRVSPPVLSLEGKFEAGAECVSPGALSIKPSSSCSSFLTVSDGGNASEYESPRNQYEFENPIEKLGDGDRDSGATGDGGDEMIDAKAEEFIARFYEQIRIQN